MVTCRIQLTDENNKITTSGFVLFLSLVLIFAAKATPSYSNDFAFPWRDKNRAIVIDAYEKNPINWEKLTSNKQIVGFIGKASDGLPPRWGCTKRNKTENTLCKKTFQNYWLKQELYKTRRMIAKNLGLKWGAYHLGRPGNPIDQANHFINFTDPGPDDLLALDIEHDDPKKWISLKDAETFVKHIKFRLGRYPVLYTNHNTAKRIAARRAELPVLSRLPLWYARFKSNVRGAFPIGNWDTYALWQFSARANCNRSRCLYRVSGAQTDIDVNVAPMSKTELREAWPFGGLVPAKPTGEETELLMASATPASPKAPEKPKPIERFKADLEIENRDGTKILLSSIAVPTARNPIAVALGFSVVDANQTIEVADLGNDLVQAMVPATDSIITNYVVERRSTKVGENHYGYTQYSSGGRKDSTYTKRY